jgi:hypothetical protein
MPSSAQTTQSNILATAEQTVRDYIETPTDLEASDAEIIITPELTAGRTEGTAQ